MSEKSVAVTHNGKFHADEVFATAVLQQLYPDLEVIRSRDPATIAQGDFVYDVGGIYDHETRRYDHHQPGALKRESGLTRSAFGLIWLHYGQDYCEGDEAIWERIDKRLVRGIDAGDNGERQGVEDLRAPEFGISHMIELYNPLPENTREEADAQFAKAVGHATFLLDRLKDRARAELASAREVREAMTLTSSNRYAFLDRQIQISDCIAEIEELEYIVFPDAANNTWQVYALPTPENHFVQKRPFPENWAGLTGEQLQKVTGVSDAIFCHTKRFLTVAESREGARRLLEFALAEPYDSVVSLDSPRYHSAK